MSNCVGSQEMSGRTGFQSSTGNSYGHPSQSHYRPVENDAGWWDDEPSSSVAHVTQVFCNQSLRTTVGDDWNAWDGEQTPKAASVPTKNYGNYGRQDDIWQSGVSGQYPDGVTQQGRAVQSTADDVPTDMRIAYGYIGLVVGKGGSRIKELQQASGAKIFVRKDDVDASGLVLVAFEGDETSRINAKRMISELIGTHSDTPSTGRMDDRQSRQTSNQFRDNASFGDTTALTVAPNMIGAVIGRGGRKVREIEDRTQTKIHIDKHCGEITINGAEEGREQAKSLIEDAIRSESETLGYTPDLVRLENVGRQQNSVSSGSAELQVPTNMLGALIGRGGQNIKDISDKTQTKIKISDDRHGVTVDVTITGSSEEGRLEAKSLIEGVFHSTSEARYSSNSVASNFNASDHQHRSGFGSCGNNWATDRSHFTPEGSLFTNSHAGSSQRSGFGGFDHSEPAERSFGNTERSSFGTASRQGFGGMIDWDQVKELSRLHEEEKWKSYPLIKKDFYIEDAGVANMDPEEVAAIREQNNNIMVSCDEDSEAHIPNPVRNFDDGFLHYPEILDELQRAGFTKPSPIQMQGWPIALQGLDLIGIAQTGTGKTLAFLLPAFIHIEGQPVPRGKRGGPNVLVLSPTRELALQVSKINVMLSFV